MKQQAFLILAHKDPEQVNRLVQQLDAPEHFIFIHIDKKVEITPFSQLITYPNVHFVNQREVGNWGDLGIVLATINGIKEVLEKGIEFSHLHLLSGQDFPLKSNKDIQLFFSANMNIDFIEHQQFPVSHMAFGGMERIHHHSFNAFGKRHTYLPFRYCENLSLKGYCLNIGLFCYQKMKGKRKIPYGLVPFYGSQWWSLTKHSLAYIIAYLEDHKTYSAYHRHSLLPDEMFFQTILLNAKSLAKPENNNLRYIDWSENTGSHPKELNEEDLIKLRSSTCIFARKFATGSSLYALLNLD